MKMLGQVTWVVCLLGACFLASSAALAKPKEALRPYIRAFVIAQLKPDEDKRLEREEPTRVATAELQLEGGRKEVLVYVTGGGWCGSGGCRMLIIEQKQKAIALIAETSITWPPIRRLSTSSHGHPDIGVWVRGGGIQPGYQAILRFDGKAYPQNPSTPPAIRSPHESGVLLIGDEKGELLYK